MARAAKTIGVQHHYFDGNNKRYLYPCAAHRSLDREVPHQVRDEAPRIDPAVRELAVLSALAALGCGLAAVQGDLWFVAVFSAASVVTIIEAIRRLQ
jgi:hypothetical protein